MANTVIERARRLLAEGDVAGARGACESVLAAGAGPADAAIAHLLLASCFRRGGDIATALSHVRTAIEITPRNAMGHYALAELLEESGDKHAAIDSLRRAIELNAEFIQGYQYLGILLGETGDVAGAATSFERALRFDPKHARTWNNLGSAQRTLGRLEDAAQSFVRALALRPDYALAACNLAVLQRDEGRADLAEATLREALSRQAGGAPHYATLSLLAALLRERGDLDQAIEMSMRALDAAPAQGGEEWMNVARAMTERGEPEQARKAYRRALPFLPGDLRPALGMRLTLPMIYANAQAVAEARSEYAAGLAELEQRLPTLIAAAGADQVLDGLRWTNFFLAYQGGDDRELQAAYARLAARAIDIAAPQWRSPIEPRPVAGRRIRVGFASAFFKIGTIGQYFRRWITDLDSMRFDVFVYHLRPREDEVVQEIRRRADHFRAFSRSDARPPIVAPVVRADDLDALIYPELGMDETSFALSALRLAPRQYAAWGHPVTSGQTTIDAFFTCATMEPRECEMHYTERLVKLPGIGTRYPMPDAPPPASRQSFGLPDDAALLLCPQSLFKIHPDNDELFAEVLAASPRAILVLFAGRHPAITDQFMQRLTRVFDRHGIAVRERTRVLPDVAHEQYLQINRACDAMLDTLHWSGGNTSLDALACGLPIVTLPGAFMRGRQSCGMLSLLGLPELIARDRAEYVAIASRLAADAAWRHEIARRIVEHRSRLFGDSAAIEALQQILQDAVRSA